MKSGLFTSSLLALSLMTAPVFAKGHTSKLGKKPSASRVEASIIFDSASEESIVAIVNQERAANGLAPVSVDPRLREAARGHSKDMGELGFFDHTSPVSGKAKFTDRIKAQGHSKFGAAGENIAAGSFNPQDRAESFMDMWMKSPGHRANILGEDYRYIGVGVYVTASGEVYSTQVFTSVGSTRASPSNPIEAPVEVQPTPELAQPEDIQPKFVPSPEELFDEDEDSQEESLFVPSTPSPKRSAPPQSSRSENEAKKAKIYWLLEQLAEPDDQENGVTIIVTPVRIPKSSVYYSAPKTYYKNSKPYYTPKKKSSCQ
jgi:uncharacterized protein YkwD